MAGTSHSIISRRELIRRGGVLGGVLAAPMAHGLEAHSAGASTQTVVRSGALAPGADVYRSIGVRPLINARGTFTIISGSTMLPEVRAAMDAAARKYVHLDELTDAAGARLAALTGAEWGLVTNGCSAGLTLATAACVAGGNPDLHVRLPNLGGFARDEAIIPTHSRNVYDAAIRAVGLRVVEVSTPSELEAALGPRTALVYIMAGPRVDAHALNLKTIATVASAKHLPVLVDAAAEILTVPNVHLQNGATLVAYSGGKCLRGPQTAGLLLGRKDLVKAAWVHSAPHHGFGRALKVGKEDAIGMLMAVEMWVKRDHEGEQRRWTSWLEHIAGRLAGIAGVTATIVQPNGLSNKTPTLQVLWDRQALGTTGEVVSRMLLEGEPRIALSAAGGAAPLTGVSIAAYMMDAGDERIVADRLHAILTRPPAPPTAPSGTSTAELAGQWSLRIQFAASSAVHTLHLTQRGTELGGFHQGDFMTREIAGSLDGESVRIRSAYGEQHGDSVSLTFTGTVAGDEMSGTLDMGEYLGATWTATRRAARRG